MFPILLILMVTLVTPLAAANDRRQQLTGRRLDPLLPVEVRQEFDTASGFRSAQRYLSKRSARFLKKRFGKGFLIGTIAPVLIDAFSRAAAPRRHGEIAWKGPVTGIDNTLNSLTRLEKRRLAQGLRKLIPTLPVLGNLPVDLLNGQQISFSDGVPHYRVRIKRRVAPELGVGPFSFGGGAETLLKDWKWKGSTPVASFRYTKGKKLYHLTMRGSRIGFELRDCWIDLRLNWATTARRLTFRLNLSL